MICKPLMAEQVKDNAALAQNSVGHGQLQN